MKNIKYAIKEPERHGEIPVKKGCIQGKDREQRPYTYLTKTFQRPSRRFFDAKKQRRRKESIIPFINLFNLIALAMTFSASVPYIEWNDRKSIPEITLSK